MRTSGSATGATDSLLWRVGAGACLTTVGGVARTFLPPQICGLCESYDRPRASVGSRIVMTSSSALLANPGPKSWWDPLCRSGRRFYFWLAGAPVRVPEASAAL